MNIGGTYFFHLQDSVMDAKYSSYVIVSLSYLKYHWKEMS
jgi:hypothetical protein